MASDFEFRRKILDTHSSQIVNFCLQCGRCTTECPVAKEVGKEKYDPRELILNSFLGLKGGIFGKPSPGKDFPENFNLWGCTVCDKCDEICPQKIRLTEIFTTLKNMSVELGQQPEFYTTQAKTIYENTKAIPLQAAIERRRETMGLPKLPEAELQEIQTILTEAGFTKVIK